MKGVFSGHYGVWIDTVGPVELLKGEVPITVNPGEKISFLME